MTAAVVQLWLIVILALWALAGLWSLRPGSRVPLGLAMVGAAGLWALIAALWLALERPPLRTLGETRLWYGALIVTIGLLVEWRFALGVVRLPMLVLAGLFLSLDVVAPDTLDRTLMPALHSPWFVPHVAAYLTAYALLGLSAITTGVGLVRGRQDPSAPLLLAWLGLPMLTVGMILGAIWAKQAWGHYWAWDPKETWALLTWITYVAVLHHAHPERCRPRTALWLLAIAFTVVLLCWFAVQHLPSVAVSVHTYTQG